LGAKGIRRIFYLDDILIIGPSFNICLEHMREALLLLVGAGFLIHERKSCLVPSTAFPFLGFQWDTLGASLSIPQLKVDALHVQAKTLLGLTSPSFCQEMVLTGLIVAFCKAVPLLRLKGRWLQMNLNQVYETEKDLQKSVTLGQLAKRDLQWIVELSLAQCSTPLWHLSPEDCDLEVQTDASKEGFRVWFQGFLHQGKWDSITAGLHINVLETIAIWHFLAFILPKLSKLRNILWRIDNTTALAYIKKEGGTISSLVLAEAEKALVLVHQMSVRFLLVYIPTEENILADAASCFQEIPDWKLHPFIFKAITARWCLPVIDLFASNASKQTKHFYSWNAFDNPEGIDTVSQRWDFTLAYAFPPVALLRVVKKLETSRGIFILISPLWEAQTWLALLLTLKVLEVRQLPLREDLVTDLMMGTPPPPDPAQPSSSLVEALLPLGPPRQRQGYPQVALQHRRSL
jgi:hypothetical protein